MNDGGSIILNGSVASVKGTPAFGVYGATKAALRSFVRTWTSDLKDRHIRSNVVNPGPTDTPIVDGQPEDAIARIVSTIPMGRMGDPDEIAKAALFLASDDSSFVTGIELFVDGVERKSDPETLHRRPCHVTFKLDASEGLPPCSRFRAKGLRPIPPGPETSLRRAR
jgi:hypothetical protein